MAQVEAQPPAASRSRPPTPPRARQGTSTLAAKARAASGLSLFSVAVGFGLQFAFAPTLLHHWGEGGYAFFVAVQGFASYVSVADAGVQMYFVQRVASLRAARDDAAADALTTSCFRLLRVLALAGGALVFGAFVVTGHAIWERLAHSLGVSPALALAAAFAQVGAGAVALVCGGWSTVVDYGRNRHARVQAFGAVKVVCAYGGVLVLARSGTGAAPTLIAVALATTALDAGRFAITRAAEPAPSGPRVSLPLGQLLYGARGSGLLNIATNTQAGLQPYVTASLSPAAVSVAIPARTLANGCRAFSNAIGGAVWVAIAARLSEHDDARARYAFWVRNAPALTLVQLGALGGLLTVGPVIVPHWLPSKSAGVLGILHWCAAEQAVYAATMPSFFLLSALGRFGVLGLTTLAFVLTSLVGIWATVPHYGAAGFAASNAIGALVVLAPLLLAVERAHWRRSGIPAPYAVYARYGVGLAAAALSLLSAQSPKLAPALIFVLVAAVAAHWMRARRRPPKAPGPTGGE
jgi:O-antigen/teichoic acid export membrane protein